MREHVGLEQFVRVVEANAHAQGAGFFVQRRINVVQRALPDNAGVGLHGHVHGLAFAHPAALALQHFGNHPYGIELADAQDFHGGFDECALTDFQLLNETRLFGVIIHALAGFAGFAQLCNQFVIDAQ